MKTQTIQQIARTAAWLSVILNETLIAFGFLSLISILPTLFVLSITAIAIYITYKLNVNFIEWVYKI